MTFTNEDSFVHQIYVDGQFESDEKGPGENINQTFPRSGTFQVRCHIHPTMKPDGACEIRRRKPLLRTGRTPKFLKAPINPVARADIVIVCRQVLAAACDFARIHDRAPGFSAPSPS